MRIRIILAVACVAVCTASPHRAPGGGRGDVQLLSSSDELHKTPGDSVTKGGGSASKGGDRIDVSEDAIRPSSLNGIIEEGIVDSVTKGGEKLSGVSKGGEYVNDIIDGANKGGDGTAKGGDSVTKGGRNSRFLWAYRSYPRSPIVDMMMQSTAPNYAPKNAGDPFDFLRDSYPLPKGATSPLPEYDYVVVGASAAGSALAARLSAERTRPRATVLLLEAGRPEMLLTDVPALAGYFGRTDYAWGHSMERQPGVCLGIEGQRCFVPRGKAVGGSSVINNLVYSRGRPQDWDRIAADGNYGWSYADVLKYFIRSERCELKHYKRQDDYKSQAHRGRDGELTVENVSFRTGLMEAFLEAGRHNGHPTVDYNAPDGLGFGYAQINTINGHRQSAAKAYLHPHKRRTNLHIAPESRVTTVLFDGKRATGVEYVRNGLKFNVKARKEVILSAGPIASPQLLMLSGIGPETHLQSLNIPVVKNLNVGRTLYDHISFPGLVFTLNTTNASILEEKAATLPNLLQWLQYGEGLLSSPGMIEGIGYIKTAESKDVVPDIELVSLGGSIVSDAGGAMRLGMKIIDEVYYSAFGSVNNRDTWSAVPVLLHPKSKGYLELRDRNPFSQPKIYGNYLTAIDDVKTMISAIRYIIKLAESPSFQKYNAKLHRADYPPCRTFPYGSDDFWECAIRTLTVSYREQTSTCRMGPATDPDAVVDPELRVHGIEGLRVVDSSVIPRTISGHSSTADVMIGEKAADLIRNTWANHVRR